MVCPSLCSSGAGGAGIWLGHRYVVMTSVVIHYPGSFHQGSFHLEACALKVGELSLYDFLHALNSLSLIYYLDT